MIRARLDQQSKRIESTHRACDGDESRFDVGTRRPVDCRFAISVVVEFVQTVVVAAVVVIVIVIVA